MRSVIPKVSVIVPVHNTEPYLFQCLSSIVRQSLMEWELICIDDGSTDGSLDIMQSIAESDNRVKILTRKTASGSAAVPRNMGLKQARGEYVIFLDADDYFDKFLLEKLYNCAVKVQADLVMCDNYVIETETGRISTEYSELHRERIPSLEFFSYKDIPNSIFQISNAAAWHRLIKKKILDDTGLVFQEGTPILDDMFFVNAVLIMAKRVSVIYDRLIYYRVQRPGAQTTQISMHKDSVFKVFYRLNTYLIQQKIYHTVKKSLQEWTISTMWWWLYSIHEFESFVSMYRLYQQKYLKELKLLDADVSAIRSEVVRDFFYKLKNDSQLPIPFNILEAVLPTHANIILYGAGRVGRRMYALIKGYDKANLCLWCDKNAENMQDERIKHPREMQSCSYDAVIIAIRDKMVVQSAIRELENYGVDKNVIFTLDGKVRAK